MKIYLVYFLLLATAISCTKDEVECGGVYPPAETHNFLEPLTVGDKLYYSLLIGENYYDQTEEVYAYTGDTLELEVTGKSNAGVEITERITAGSNMIMSDTADYYYHKNSVFTNTWKIEGDSLFIQPGAASVQSHLTGIHRLKLGDYSGPQTELTGWRTTYPYAETNILLFTTNYTLFGQSYDTLSVFVHNQPMSYDGNGSTLVYSASYGIVRTSTYGWWTQSGYGWDRVF